MTQAQVYQAGLQALTATSAAAQVEQAGLVAFTGNNSAAQIEQAGLQALTVNASAAEIFQTGVIAFVRYKPTYEIYQLGAEALTVNDPAAQVEQLGVQALTVNDPAAQIYHAGLMAFVRYLPPPASAPLTATRRPGTLVDAALIYDPTLRALDAVFTGTDFGLDETPASVLLGSLLVDRRAHPDDTWPAPVPDWANPSSFNARRGWVGDALDPSGRLVGSRLWELDRRDNSEQTRSDCQDYLVEALTPLETVRGYAIQINVAWEKPQILGYSVTVGATTIQLKKALN